ncbi:MAG: hypothetical protein J5911_02665 [Clostridia bacterium]|nr:hypothetical protein [Clostridia bacterium]
MGNKSKAETFIGFAVKSGKFRSGYNTLATLKKAYLILVCRTAAENTVKAAVKYAAGYRCRAFVTTDCDLCDLAHKEGAKIAAITDLSLAKAITVNAAPNLQEIVSGK